MLFSDVSPFVRFAEVIHYASAGTPVRVRDCRMFYILSGEGKIFINSQTCALVPHTVFYCSKGSIYNISSEGMKLISINFDLSHNGKNREQPYSPVPLPEWKEAYFTHEAHVEDQSLLNGYLFLPNAIACREYFDDILMEFSTKRLLYQENAGTLLKALLVQLLRRNTENASESAKVPEKIIDYIRIHYREPLLNTLFSKMFGYHEYHLNRLFLKHTGRTIRQYILDVRISHAKKLLLNTELPLSVIAETVGFNSNSYFSTYFRQVVGISPARFREKYKNTL